MPKWKIQAVEPNTCEPFDETIPITPEKLGIWERLAVALGITDPAPTTEAIHHNGCRYYELWDSLSPPPATPVVVCAVIRICLAHAVGTNATKGKLKWSDGNWKDIKSYIKYQREWFRWVNHQEWLSRAPKDEFGDLQPMPPQIAKFTTEPVTAGSIVTPSQAEQDDLVQVYAWNREHNDRMNTSLAIMRNELGMTTDADREQFDEAVTWRFEGHGDARLFFVNSGGLLSNQEKNRIEATVDIQFGPGKVVVEG